MGNHETVEPENLAIGPLFAVTGVATFFVLAVILALTSLHDSVERDIKASFNAELPTDTLELGAEQRDMVESYSAGEGGKVRIPVEDAMEMVLEEQKDG